MSTTHTWSVAEDHNLVSVPQNDNHLYAQYSISLKSVLNKVREGTFEVLLMIDAIQRLGIDYHFHDEIEAILQRQYRIVITTDDFRDNLYEVALRFRLLRQEGYYSDGNTQQKKYKLKWKMLSLHFAPVFALFLHIFIAKCSWRRYTQEARNFSNQHLNAWNTHNDQHQVCILGIVDDFRELYLLLLQFFLCGMIWEAPR
ncbi:hypothetical protein AAG906_028976 [Vitis piasezkii]